jgi:hypothetical protein
MGGRGYSRLLQGITYGSWVNGLNMYGRLCITGMCALFWVRRLGRLLWTFGVSRADSSVIDHVMLLVNSIRPLKYSY